MSYTQYTELWEHMSVLLKKGAFWYEHQLQRKYYEYLTLQSQHHLKILW
jgi:hypothetical protein